MENRLGIIFTGGLSPDSSIVKHYIKGLDAFIVAADSGLIAAESAGVVPEYIVGDMDSIDRKRLNSYPSEKIIRYPAEKDYTDTELAFSLTVANNCKEIWIIGGGGGRIDHLFGIRSLFERDRFPSRWITDSADIYSLDAKSRNKLTFTEKKNDIVSVFPLGSGPWKINSSGLKWALSGITWDRGFYGVSNVADENNFSLAAEEGRFMVILPLLRID